MSRIQAVLNEFMPCGGTVCPGCETTCHSVDGRTPNNDRMADEIITLRAERDALRNALQEIAGRQIPGAFSRDHGEHAKSTLIATWDFAKAALEAQP